MDVDELMDLYWDAIEEVHWAVDIDRVARHPAECAAYDDVVACERLVRLWVGPQRVIPV